MRLRHAALATLLFAPAAAAAEPDSLSSPRAELRAVRTESAPAIDGRLDDPAWLAALPIEGFRQRNPREGAESSQRTVVRLLYDDAALYVGVHLHDTAPDSVVAQLTRRDQWSHSDYFLVMLDPYHDRRSGYFFGINAGGTLFDGVLYNDVNDDSAWDGVWQGRTLRDETGWTAEFRIPYSQLRFSREDVQVWGVNFRRDIARRQERSYLHVVPSTESGFVSHFPDLVGIERIRPGRGVEVVPYVTSRASFTSAELGNPFDNGAGFSGEAGVDLRLGVTRNLTLNATVNPDFGQVEVDPAVVNLSAFETFFEERRPFFVEGASVFSFGSGPGRTMGFNWVNMDPFYSRRIGRAPVGSIPDHSYADVPSAARILGAGKLTGRMGATNIGVLGALTGGVEAHLALADGSRQSLEIEPLAAYGVVRALREFNEGRRGLGLMATGVRRQVDAFQAPGFNESAATGGLDGWTQFAGGTWVLKGWLSGSHVTGSAERLVRLQRSATHYLQRPDRDSYRIDSTRTSLTGFAGRVILDKARGHWMVNATLGVIDPHYDLNDIGFLGRSDVINTHLFVGHYTTEPGTFFRQRTLMAAVFNNLNFDLDRNNTGLWARAESQLLGYQYVNVGMFADVGGQSPHQTRGGPLMRYPAGLNADATFSTDERKPWGVWVGSYGDVGAGDRGIGGDLEFTWRPRPNINLSFGPGYSHHIYNSQFITSVGDALATSTFGRRYVFAELDQWQIQANLRLNWTFSPTMSLQFFAQPLVSTGAYSDYRELAAARTYDFNGYEVAVADGGLTVDPDGAGAAAPFTFSRPDFRFVSLRGNAVFRWEYRPGSALFVVWTQQREDNSDDGTFSFGPAVRRVFVGRPDNVVAVKVTYWLGR